MIYFDSAASYPLLPEVKAELVNAFDKFYANSASTHYLGDCATKEVERVRELLADSIGAYPSEVVFTSGATESNNIAFKSLLLANDFDSSKKHIITSQIEHKCVFSICDYLKSCGFEVTYIKPNETGLIEVTDIKKALRSDTALVSIMHVNNELGTVNPIAEIGELCSNKNILFHSDAAQSFKKVEIDVDDLNVDVMSFSAHKIGGPKGIGAIYIRDLRHRHLMPVIHGAGQEDGLRGGTVATPLISAFAKAIDCFGKHYDNFKIIDARNYLLESLKRSDIQFVVNGLDSLPSCVSITFPQTNTNLLLRATETKLCLAQGSACSSKSIEPSHVLTAIGLTRELADKTLRISFTLNVSNNEIEEFVQAIKKATE
ncbi:cysteine desulfurase [Shewanella sp. 10N.7]|uniref:cysteine desulfurase family protein n=1 Tax=Shewanella sp. 10N.7 TaxID=2885093 RepID=UPI001E49D7DD|nr:cysteine desulfurase family protein [Shewanella sp. 10N.7]MCC4832823.1 cysteine desulfurase [Shewanella sp. 10N.7]